MTPSRTREVAEELALLFASSWDGKRRLADRIEAALLAAEERGRVAGLKQAAKVAGASDYPMDRLYTAGRTAAADAIRSLIGGAK